VISSQDIRQGGGIVSSAALPRHFSQVRAVVDTEVRKRHEILLVDRVPYTEFGGNASVEVAQDVEAIGTLGGGGHPKELSWRDAFEKHPVRRGSSVMELVDKHDIEVGRIDRLQSGSVEALNRREHVFKPRGASSADP
jgi:hypothetical protein